MKISVIVPYYNAKKWIRRCCESLHNNKGEFEFIFVNDRSLDNSETIVNTDTDSIEFFASAKPLPRIYPKHWAEPFAFKVKNTEQFFKAIEKTKALDEQGLFKRQPVSWEFWQVIKGTPLNKVDYTNYVRINDYTCDIDEPKDIKLFERFV